MSLLDYFRSNKKQNTAQLAKERLQIIVAHERSSRGGPDYLPQLKQDISLEHARTLLREGQLNVQQVAQATGFADAASFARAFKRATGQTPSEARQGHGAPTSTPDTPQDTP